MRFGVFTFLNDTGVGPVDLAIALESRGFGSLFVAEHSRIPVDVLAGGLAKLRELAGAALTR